MEIDRRLRIPLVISDLFYESELYKNNPNYSLSLFCSKLIEKYFSGEMIELSAENFNNIKLCANKIEKDNSFVVNAVLEKIDIVPLVKPEKIKLEIAPHKQIIKTRSKKINNQVANW